ncbi:hypothetical protein ZWY2020_020676 [Hordeum vulgare]|nr:hypothetical protein ZWY2020_020676 [Hordeum vulgare]
MASYSRKLYVPQSLYSWPFFLILEVKSMTQLNSCGQIKRYDAEEDVWRTMVPHIPVHDFTDAESPYLLTGLHGRLHVITKEANNNLQVIQAVLENNTGNDVPEGNVLWNIVASKNFGAAELISCQVLNV